MNEHPSKDIVGSYGDYLKGKNIVLCITSSVSSYKAVELARLLMRYGAEVYPVMSKNSLRFITPELMHWATGNKVITKLTTELEHIRLANHNKADLIIIYPCTANTLSKIACGISDSLITTIVSVALGTNIPIIIAPAMHEAMYLNPILRDNVEKLKKYVTFAGPTFAEGKAKLAEIEYVVDLSIRLLSESKLKGKKVLVTAGPTIEYIDPIRIITNISSGKFGVEIAKTAYRLGADVSIVYGHGSAIVPSYLDVIKVNTSKEMLEVVYRRVKEYDILIMNAAVADYTPIERNDKKIESNKELIIRLTTTEKIVDKVKDINDKVFLVAFKALYNVSDDILIEEGKKKKDKCKADIIFVNDLARKGNNMGSDYIEGFIISDEVTRIEPMHKSKAAKILLQHIESKIT